MSGPRRRRRRGAMETPEYAEMMRRLIRRYGVRVGKGDPVDLTTMVEIREAFDAAIAQAVAGQIAEGYSWREVGEGLGTTKEAAWQRYRSQIPAASDSVPLQSA